MNNSHTNKPLMFFIHSLLILFAIPRMNAENNIDGTGLYQLCDLQAAIEYCDNNALQKPEGIWLYPEDNVIVAIIKDKFTGDGNITAESYNIIVVETPDCKLSPGMILGRLISKPEAKFFEMKLFTGIKGLSLLKPVSCLATLVNNNRAMTVEAPSVKISINPVSILPRFWRTLKFKFSNPLEKAKSGMVKIYPNDAGTPPHTERVLYF